MGPHIDTNCLYQHKKEKKEEEQDCLLIYDRTARECVHLVTCVHFRSRDKDGGHIIRSAVPKNSMLHTNITTLCLIEQELLPIEVLHCRNRNFLIFYWLL